MSSRMDKYYNTNHNQSEQIKSSRMQKNEQLYQEINNSELDSINLTSNAHVIGDNDSFDVDKIKELIEKTYGNETPRKNKTLDTFKEEPIEIDDEEEITKEYDINAILKKAKIGKDIDYERERLKKIHDTQYNILKSLDLKDKEEKPKSKVTSDKEGLMELIHTITEKELTREMQPLDLLSDLKGGENTVVLEGIKEKPKDAVKPKTENKDKKEIDKTFYTNSLSFTQSDFDDFNDLKEDVESNKIIVRVLLIIVGIVLIVGAVFLINAIFHLNLF